MTVEEAIEILDNEYKRIELQIMSLKGTIKENTESFRYRIDVKESLKTAITALKEIQQYREIGTVEECRKAVEKQKPKIPIFEHMLGEWTGKFRCPICKKVVTHDCRDTKNTFCENCGQAIQFYENLEGMEDE